MAALLIATEAAPHWADSAPQCVLGDDGGIAATRCEARVQPARDDAAAVLVDIVDLQVCSPRHALCSAVYVILSPWWTDALGSKWRIL